MYKSVSTSEHLFSGSSDRRPAFPFPGMVSSCIARLKQPHPTPGLEHLPTGYLLQNSCVAGKQDSYKIKTESQSVGNSHDPRQTRDEDPESRYLNLANKDEESVKLYDVTGADEVTNIAEKNSKIFVLDVTGNARLKNYQKRHSSGCQAEPYLRLSLRELGNFITDLAPTGSGRCYNGMSAHAHTKRIARLLDDSSDGRNQLTFLLCVSAASAGNKNVSESECTLDFGRHIDAVFCTPSVALSTYSDFGVPQGSEKYHARSFENLKQTDQLSKSSKAVSRSRRDSKSPAESKTLGVSKPSEASKKEMKRRRKSRKISRRERSDSEHSIEFNEVAREFCESKTLIEKLQCIMGLKIVDAEGEIVDAFDQPPNKNKEITEYNTFEETKDLDISDILPCSSKENTEKENSNHTSGNPSKKENPSDNTSEKHKSRENSPDMPSTKKEIDNSRSGDNHDSNQSPLEGGDEKSASQNHSVETTTPSRISNLTPHIPVSGIENTQPHVHPDTCDQYPDTSDQHPDTCSEVYTEERWETKRKESRPSFIPLPVPSTIEEDNKSSSNRPATAKIDGTSPAEAFPANRGSRSTVCSLDEGSTVGTNVLDEGQRMHLHGNTSCPISDIGGLMLTALNDVSNRDCTCEVDAHRGCGMRDKGCVSDTEAINMDEEEECFAGVSRRDYEAVDLGRKYRQRRESCLAVAPVIAESVVNRRNSVFGNENKYVRGVKSKMCDEKNGENNTLKQNDAVDENRNRENIEKRNEHFNDKGDDENLNLLREVSRRLLSLQEDSGIENLSLSPSEEGDEESFRTPDSPSHLDTDPEDAQTVVKLYGTEFDNTVLTQYETEHEQTVVKRYGKETEETALKHSVVASTKRDKEEHGKNVAKEDEIDDITTDTKPNETDLGRRIHTDKKMMVAPNYFPRAKKDRAYNDSFPNASSSTKPNIYIVERFNAREHALEVRNRIRVEKLTNLRTRILGSGARDGRYLHHIRLGCWCDLLLRKHSYL